MGYPLSSSRVAVACRIAFALAGLVICVRTVSFGQRVLAQEDAGKDAEGSVIYGELESLHSWAPSWALGQIGDLCLTLARKPRIYCVKQRYLAPGVSGAEVQAALQPGAQVFMKAFTGSVAELIVGERRPDSRRLVDYSLNTGRAREEAESFGKRFILAGAVELLLLLGLGEALGRTITAFGGGRPDRGSRGRGKPIHDSRGNAA